METQEQKTPVRDVALRTIAVVGLVAVLLLGAWGIIQLAVALPNLFSNIGGGVSNIFTPGPQKETLDVSASQNVASGQSLVVSWNHKNGSGEYSYSISYACQSGLSVKAPLPTGSYQTVACNTPFDFVNATDHMTIIPASGKSAPLALTVSATKLSSGAVTSQGSITTTVTGTTAAAPAPAAVKTAVVTKGSSNASYAYYAAPVTKSLYGYADLAIQINSVAPASNGLTAMTFTIQNIGTNRAASGWLFNAVLPINGSYTFVSQPQRALNPGDKIVYQLTFTNPAGYNGGYGTTYNNYPYGYTGNGYYGGQSNYTCTGYGPCFAPSQDPIDYTYGNSNYNYGNTYGNNYGYQSGPITITVDPQNFIWESNESNNTATAY